MRYIFVAASDIKEQPGGAIATGEDDRNGDIVKFSMSLDEAAAVRRVPGASSVILVFDEDVIQVVTAGPWATVEGTYPAPGLSELLDGEPDPVSGEWDSPGTSPEEGDDDGHRAW